jgi:hypothetical protein
MEYLLNALSIKKEQSVQNLPDHISFTRYLITEPEVLRPLISKPGPCCDSGG